MPENIEQGHKLLMNGKSYTLVDTTIGSRVVLAFRASPDAVQTRLPHPWMLELYQGGYAPTISNVDAPNLLVVFNDFLLNRDAFGQPQADAQARYVGFNIPARNTETGASGMIHFRIFTSNLQSVPGRFKDALPATVVRESHLHATGADSTAVERFSIESVSGGLVELHLEYQRGAMMRLTAEQPNFPVWAAADPTILRIYQDDSLVDTVFNPSLGINHVKNSTFHVTIPELGDLFDGNEQLLGIIANPSYSRRVFSPTKP